MTEKQNAPKTTETSHVVDLELFQLGMFRTLVELLKLEKCVRDFALGKIPDKAVIYQIQDGIDHLSDARKTILNSVPQAAEKEKAGREVIAMLEKSLDKAKMASK